MTLAAHTRLALGSVAVVTALTGIPRPAGATASPPVQATPITITGTLPVDLGLFEIKGYGSQGAYLVTSIHGVPLGRRWVPPITLPILEKAGLPLKVVSESFLIRAKWGPALPTVSSNALLQGSDGKEYLVAHNSLRLIPDSTTLTCLVGRRNSISVADGDLALFLKGAGGPPLPSRADGSLLRGGTSTVFRMVQCKRHAIPDQATLQTRGWSGITQHTLSITDLNDVPQGNGYPQRHNPTYTFSLDSINILTTRSRSKDTDYAAVDLLVGSHHYGPQYVSLGNLGNGRYAVNAKFGPIAIPDPGMPIQFNYQIFNSGNGDPYADARALSASTHALEEDGAQPEDDPSSNNPDYPTPSTCDDACVGSGWVALAVIVGKAMVPYINALFADCDGMVATDQIAGTTNSFDAQMSNQGTGTATYSFTKHYNGTDSPMGCGSNSVYEVTSSVTRTDN